jgi:hypothetical protein
MMRAIEKLVIVIPLLCGTLPARAYPTDFCYERSHFALMVAEDRDTYAARQTDEDEEYGKRSWTEILRDEPKADIDRHMEIIASVWEVFQGQAPSQIEGIILRDCLKRPERYR